MQVRIMGWGAIRGPGDITRVPMRGRQEGQGQRGDVTTEAEVGVRPSLYVVTSQAMWALLEGSQGQGIDSPGSF